MRYDLYEWVVIPMALTNAPTIFMQTMKNLFYGVLNSSTAEYLDDIVVCSHTVKEYFKLLKKVLAHFVRVYMPLLDHS